MSHLTWGVDGYGRQFICERNGRDVLLCVIPKESPHAAIEDLLENGNKHDTQRTSESRRIEEPSANGRDDRRTASNVSRLA